MSLLQRLVNYSTFSYVIPYISLVVYDYPAILSSIERNFMPSGSACNEINS